MTQLPAGMARYCAHGIDVLSDVSCLKRCKCKHRCCDHSAFDEHGCCAHPGTCSCETFRDQGKRKAAR